MAYPGLGCRPVAATGRLPPVGLAGPLRRLRGLLLPPPAQGTPQPSVAGRLRPWWAASTPRLDRCDRSDQREAEDSTEPAESHDPIERIDSAEPTLPIEANDPTLPIDRTEPREPIDSTLSCDHRDHREDPDGHAGELEFVIPAA